MSENIKKIEEIMAQRGYTKSSEHRDGNGNVISISFLYMPKNQEEKRFPVPPYSVTVWVEDMEFQFAYCVPTSINQLKTPKCSAFINDEHFYGLAIKFEHDAAVLYKYCS